MNSVPSATTIKRHNLAGAHQKLLSRRSAEQQLLIALDRLGASVQHHTKFNPDQPRVPAGNSDGGQWAGDSNPGAVGEMPIDAIASIGGRALKETCEAQFDRDIFQCRMVGLQSCYEQAYQRYAACLARRPLPPFNY